VRSASRCSTAPQVARCPALDQHQQLDLLAGIPQLLRHLAGDRGGYAQTEQHERPVRPHLPDQSHERDRCSERPANGRQAGLSRMHTSPFARMTELAIPGRFSTAA
jgi:hypothetical protein